jgi:hypothetical protein
MKSLQKLRSGWDTVRAEETKLLRSMTGMESVRIYLNLQSEFELALDDGTLVSEYRRIRESFG